VNSLTALSLFSGAGGMDIGMRKAGFAVLSNLEIDKYCCETLRAAVEREKADTVVYETDIQTIDPAQLVTYGQKSDTKNKNFCVRKLLTTACLRGARASPA